MCTPQGGGFKVNTNAEFSNLGCPLGQGSPQTKYESRKPLVTLGDITGCLGAAGMRSQLPSQGHMDRPFLSGDGDAALALTLESPRAVSPYICHLQVPSIPAWARRDP